MRFSATYQKIASLQSIFILRQLDTLKTFHPRNILFLTLWIVEFCRVDHTIVEFCLTAWINRKSLLFQEFSRLCSWFLECKLLQLWHLGVLPWILWCLTKPGHIVAFLPRGFHERGSRTFAILGTNKTTCCAELLTPTERQRAATIWPWTLTSNFCRTEEIFFFPLSFPGLVAEPPGHGRDPAPSTNWKEKKQTNTR